MPNSFLKLPLSASISGKNILVSGNTSQSATPIHTTPAGTGSLDEIWLYVYNDATSSISCSILWGGTSEPTDVQRMFVLSQTGRTLFIDGKLLQNGLTVSAYAGYPSINIDGFINRITVTSS